MSIQLLKNEKILWKSYPGKKYRTFIFSSQFGIALIIALVLGKVSNEMNLDSVLGKSGVTYLTFGIIGIGLLFALYNQLMMMFTQYFITTDRVIIKIGWLNRELSSVKHENIQDIKVEQTLSERIISTGSVYIFTANDIAATVNDSNKLNNTPCFQNIDDPFYVHRLIEEAKSNRRDTLSGKNNQE